MCCTSHHPRSLSSACNEVRAYAKASATTWMTMEAAQKTLRQQMASTCRCESATVREGTMTLSGIVNYPVREDSVTL